PPRPPAPGPPRPAAAGGAVNPLGPEMCPSADVMLAFVSPQATPGCGAPGAPKPPRPAPPATPTVGTGFPDMKIAPCTWTPLLHPPGGPVSAPSGPLPAECAHIPM